MKVAAFLSRLGASALALLRAGDILLATCWLAMLYPFGLADKPTGRQMISSYVGRAQINGHRWAQIAAGIIDWCAERLGDRPHHCARAFLHYRGLDQ